MGRQIEKDVMTAGPENLAEKPRLRGYLDRFTGGVDHEGVRARVLEAGSLSGGYLMMTTLSAAIALLGLLLSSPAVVIGAMLLSPLMGPIILLGFSFRMVDWPSMRKALASLGAGFGIALVISLTLTLLSPLKEPTSEILSRAHPTLFDLMVAAFSGIAGGYAVIRQRNEAVIGVAIATALMPPLAAIGFGVGTQAWPIAGGALLLFFTNLLTIAMAAACMAAFHGFRPVETGIRRGWISTLGVLIVFALLCVPLTLGLRTITRESEATAEARSAIKTIFGPKSRVASLSVQSEKDGIVIDALVATQRFVRGASTKASDAIKAKLGSPVRVNLDQIVLANPKRLPARAPSVGETHGADARDATQDAARTLRNAVPFPDTTTLYDASSGTGTVLIGAQSGLDLAGAYALEQGLRSREGGKATEVIPPVQPLPPIPLTMSGKKSVDLGSTVIQRWALTRWRAVAAEARICGVRLSHQQGEDLEALLSAALAPNPVSLESGSLGCPPHGSPSVMMAPGHAVSFGSNGATVAGRP